MTIAKSIIDWLKGYENIDINEEITTDMLKAQSAAFGMFKTPEKNVENYNDGSQLITEYYLFLVRQDSQLDAERVSNNQWLEDLEDWVDQKNFNEDYPILKKNCSCQNIEISSPYYMQSTEGEEAVYQLSVGIQYLKER